MTLTNDQPTLHSFRIGLSGAVPEREAWSEPAMDRAILEFVAHFSALVFQCGGHIVHGSHPTFTPVILRQAKRHASSRKRKPVTLVISELWADQMSRSRAERYQTVADILVTRTIGEGGPENVGTRNASLTLMRRHLIEQMNTMVAVGGKLHATDGIVPGVLEEIELARKRGIACFLAGGLGGLTARLSDDATIISALRNGMSEERNRELIQSRDVAACAGTIIDHLLQHSESARRPLEDVAPGAGTCMTYEQFIQQRGNHHATSH